MPNTLALPNPRLVSAAPNGPSSTWSIVKRERAVIEEHGSQLGEELHHDCGRIGAVGFDGKAVCGHEAHAIQVSPAHHPNGAPAFQRNDTYEPVGQQFHQRSVAVPRVKECGGNQRLTVVGVLVFSGNQRGRLVEVVAVQWSNHQHVISTPRRRMIRGPELPMTNSYSRN